MSPSKKARAKGTREEAYFDKHLHPDLILKTVQPYPGDYYSVLERVVDDAMSQSGYQPPHIPWKHRLHSAMRDNGLLVFDLSSAQPNEKIIQQTCGYVDRLCTIVSSTLLTAHEEWIEKRLSLSKNYESTAGSHASTLMAVIASCEGPRRSGDEWNRCLSMNGVASCGCVDVDVCPSMRHAEDMRNRMRAPGGEEGVAGGAGRGQVGGGTIQ